MININTFDWEFYLDLYPDLKKNGITNKVTAINHYLNYGIKENRAPNKLFIENNIKKYKNNISIEERKIREQLNTHLFTPQFKESPLINILIRTSYRPKYFEKCIKSILNQQYNNYRIIICYDKDNSLEYLEKYSENSNVFYYHIERNLRENPEKYRFNLYCNSLLDKVDKGYIIFLDDDDCFTHKYVLNIISNNIKSEEDFLIWKFLRPDKLIYPENINNIKLGEIDTTSVCFHSKYKNNARWWNKQYGDFNFYNQLLTNKNIKFNIKFIDSTLTQSNLDEIKIGNFGN